MDYLRQFVIPFKGLKPGEHPYAFSADDLFFESFDYSEIRKGKVDVQLRLIREETMLVLHFDLAGTVTLPCDRCSEPMEIPVSGHEDLIVKFGNDFHEESESIQIIPEGETQLDVSPFIYEYIHLLIPVRRIHPEDEEGNSSCDPEIMKRIDALSDSHEPDPRWDALKKLTSKK